MAYEPGQTLDRYLIEETLSDRKHSLVLRARHQHLGTSHAVKIVRGRSASVHAHLREAVTQQVRVRQPNLALVTEVLDLGEDTGLVMDLVLGPSLAQLIADRSLSLTQIDDIAHSLFAGLEHAHAEGLVHRDINPANVLVEIDEQGLVPRITDFALTRYLGGQQERGARGPTTMGHPAYTAPEHFDAQAEPTPGSDVWSLGVMLYECLAGNLPFDPSDPEAHRIAMLSGQVAAPSTLVPGISTRHDEAVLGALRPRAADRWPDMAAMRRAWPSRRAHDPTETNSLRERYLGPSGSPRPSALEPYGGSLDLSPEWTSDIDTSELPKAVPQAPTRPLEPETNSRWAMYAVWAAVLLGVLYLVARPDSAPEVSTELQVSRPPPGGLRSSPPTTFSGVRIEGVDASEIALTRDGMRWPATKPVPAGTYDVLMTSENGAAVTALSALTIGDDEVLTLDCNASTATCTRR